MSVRPDRSGRLATLLAAAVFLAACGGSSDEPRRPSEAAAGPARPAEPPLDVPADAPLVVILGDSLAAGLHLAPDEAFPALLQRRFAKDGLPFRLVNAGVSGSTTAGGLTRVDFILKQDPDLVLVELGANDGFRGIPLGTIEANLTAIVTRLREGGARPVLLGMRLPPSYGAEYANGFDAIYSRVAEATGVDFVPFFMDGVAGERSMNQPDGIHPTPEGHRRLAENLAPPLRAILSAE